MNGPRPVRQPPDGRALVVAAQLGPGPDTRSSGRGPQVPRMWHAVEVGPRGPASRTLCGWQYNRQWLYVSRAWSKSWKPRCPYCDRLAG
jgi:hypothetical protein